jgi:hypothetical protein
VFHSNADKLDRVKRILPGVAITAVFLFGGCSLFREPEEVRQQSGRTTYRVPGGSLAEMPSPTPEPQKIPGESRRIPTGEN